MQISTVRECRVQSAGGVVQAAPAPRCRAPRLATLLGSLSLLCLPLFLLLASCASAAPSAGQRVTYLANEGVLLEAAGRKVLIDALFGDGIDGYAKVADEERARLEGASGRYADVDLVLATHAHDDHFSPRAVESHLRANARALFVSTPDAVQRLPDELAARAMLPPEGRSVRLQHRGIDVEIFQMHHGRGRPEIQNLGFVVTLGGTRFLHVGDTELSLAEWRALELQQFGIDVALLPAWQVSEEKLAAIGARQVVAFHLAEASAPRSWFGPYRSREARIAALEQVAGLEVFRSSGEVLEVATPAR